MKKQAPRLPKWRRVLRRRWIAIALVALLGLCGGLGYAVTHAREPRAAVLVRQDALVGLVAGLFVGVVGVLILARRHHRLRRRDHISDAMGAPVLAYMDTEQYKNVADWIRLLERFEPPALNALILQRVLRHLVPADWQGPFTIRVISFAGDQAALTIGPELALFSAGSGIPTRLASDENIALEPLIAACAAVRASNHPDPLLTFSTERAPSKRPIIRPTRWYDDPALIEPNLVVSVVAVDPSQPELTSMVGPTILALSSGFAFVDDLDRVTLASTTAGLKIEGVVVVNPDPSDTTTGLLPGHRLNGSKAHDHEGDEGSDRHPPSGAERQNGHRPPGGRRFHGYADNNRESWAEPTSGQRPLVGRHFNGYADQTTDLLAPPPGRPAPLDGQHFNGYADQTTDLLAPPPGRPAPLDGQHFNGYADQTTDLLAPPPGRPAPLDGRHFNGYADQTTDLLAPPPGRPAPLDGRHFNGDADKTGEIPGEPSGGPSGGPGGGPAGARRQALRVWKAVGGGRAHRLLNLVPERHQRKARFVLVGVCFTIQFIILETLVHLGVGATAADAVALLGAAAGVLGAMLVTYLVSNSLIFRPGRREASADAKASPPSGQPGPASSSSPTPTGGIRRNMTSLLLSQMATFALSIATIAIVPKRLGSASYGAFAVATSFVTFFVLAATLGWGDFLVKRLAREPSEVGRYIFNAFAAKTVYGLAIAAAAVAGSRILRYPPEVTLLIEICSISIVLTALIDVLGAGLQATQRFGRFAFWSAVSRYVSGGLAILLLLAHRGVVAYAVVVSAAAIIPVVAYTHQLWPDMKGHVRLEPRLWKAIFAGGLPFFIYAVVLQIYSSIDVLMLQKMTNSSTVGWYSVAYAWVSIQVFFPGLLVAAAFPTLSSRAASRSPDFSPTVNKSLQLAVFVATPVAIGIALIAPNIMGLFHYPAQFKHAVVLIQILSIGMPIVAINMILGIAVAAIDRQKAWLLVGCVGVLFNPAVNLVAIPATSRHYGNGAIGASIVTVATELVIMAGAIWLRPAGVLDRRTLSFLVRTLLAGAAMIPMVLLVRNLPFEIMVAVGIATFAGACCCLRLVSPRMVRGHVSQLLKSARERARPADLPSQVGSP